jgi:hypothetical protein
MKQPISTFDFLVAASCSGSAWSLARRLGVTVWTVHTMIERFRRRGIEIAFKPRPTPPYKTVRRKPEREMQAVELADRGWTVEQIASHMTVEPETVEIYLYRHQRRTKEAA